MKRTLQLLTALVLLMTGLQACQSNDLEQGYGYYLCVAEMTDQGTLSPQLSDQIRRGLSNTAINEKRDDLAISEFNKVIRRQCAAFELLSNTPGDCYVLKFRLLNGSTAIKITEARFEFGKGFTYQDQEIPKDSPNRR